MNIVKGIVLIVGTSVVLLLVINFTSILALIWVTGNEGNGDSSFKKGEVRTYKSVQYNPTDDSISYGFATMYDNIISENSEEYIHYIEGEEHTLISNFGSKTYTCSGKCYCQSSRKTSSSSTLTPIRTGLFTLLSAASTVLAIELAKKSFQQECEDYNNKNNIYVKMGGGYEVGEDDLVDGEYDDGEFEFFNKEDDEFTDPKTCEEYEKVMSEVDRCMATEHDDETGFEEDMPITHLDEMSERLDQELLHKSGKYWCSGHCMHNEDYLRKKESSSSFWASLTNPSKKSQIQESGIQKISEECKQITLSTLIVIDPDEEKKDNIFDDADDPYKKFQRYHLAPLCFLGGKSPNVQDTKKLFDAVKNIYGGNNDDDNNNNSPENNNNNNDREDTLYDDPDGFGKCIDSNPPNFHNPSIHCFKEGKGAGVDDENFEVIRKKKKKKN